MVTFSQPITIYSKWESGPEDYWIETHIPNCSWYGHQGANIGENGLVTADQYVVRVLAQYMDNYIKPDDWNALNAKPQGVWTIQLGDVIVKGTVTNELLAGIVTDVTRKYQDCITVTGVYDNRREVGFMQHLRIEGK